MSKIKFNAVGETTLKAIVKVKNLVASEFEMNLIFSVFMNSRSLRLNF